MMMESRDHLHRRARRPAGSYGRLAALVVLSAAAHVGAFGAVLTVWGPGRSNEPAPSQVVLVDLVSTTATSVSGKLMPTEPPRGDADAPALLAKRVAELGADNAALAARLRDQEQRTAQLEAAHREALAARDTAMSELGDELGALVADRDALSRELATSRERAAALEQELATRRQAEDAAKAEMAATYERLMSSLREEIEAKDIALERANARVTVAIVERVLFPSGQAQLTADGERVIDKVGAALAGVRDRRIVIEGHTDDVPIGPELRSRFASNWELSTARATVVVKRLIEHADIPRDRLQAVGRADTDPVAANDTDAGRRLNRRIEIILLPPESGPTS